MEIKKLKCHSKYRKKYSNRNLFKVKYIDGIVKKDVIVNKEDLIQLIKEL